MSQDLDALTARAAEILREASRGVVLGGLGSDTAGAVARVIREAYLLGRSEAGAREGDCLHPGQARRGGTVCTACGEDLYRGCGSVEGMAGELTRRGILAEGEHGPMTRDDLAWLLDSTSPAAVAMQRWARDAAAGSASVIAPGPLQAEGTWPNPVQEGPSDGS